MNQNSSEPISYNEFYSLLENLVKSGSHHVLYFKTNKGRLITIAVSDHEIVFINYGIKRGRAALEDISMVESGTYRLSNDRWLEADNELPSTDQILSKLAPDASSLPGSISNQLVDSLSEMMAAYLGPIARTLCEQVLSEFDTAEPNYLAIIEKLSAEIDDPADAEEFRKKAKTLAI